MWGKVVTQMVLWDLIEIEAEFSSEQKYITGTSTGVGKHLHRIQ